MGHELEYDYGKDGDSDGPAWLRDMLERELEPDERVEWTGTPKARFFTPSSVGAFLFAIPWTGFAIFWTCGAAGFKIPDFNKGSDFFPLFGIPFILIGLGMLSAPLWNYRGLKKTLYAISDKRALILRGGRTVEIKSYMPDDLSSLHRKERRDGSGDIFFDTWTGADSESVRANIACGFEGVPDVRDVELRLRKLAEKAKGREDA